MEIARVFFNVSMSLGFPGLTGVLNEAGMKAKNMKENQLTLFINKKHTRFKMLIGQNYLLYHNNGERRFPLEAVKHFPSFFDGKRINVSGAIEKSILEKFNKKE